MLTEQSIIDFLNNFEYDIRKSHNGRWIDQKCTPDVLSFIADCIYNYAAKNPEKQFCTKDIWFSDFAVQNTESVFKKPSPKQNAFFGGVNVGVSHIRREKNIVGIKIGAYSKI